MMHVNRIGLTKLYNLFHAHIESDPRIEGLRALQREMDVAIACAYGWEDIDLKHGFHEVPYLPENDRVRYTISETARVEVLRRLSDLNRQRYEEEVTQGLHGSKATGAAKRAPRTKSASSPQPSFDFDAVPADESSYPMAAEPRANYQARPAHAIAEYLSTNVGWHAKADVLNATGITDGQWSTAVAELIASGRIECQGERRGARYRLVGGEV